MFGLDLSTIWPVAITTTASLNLLMISSGACFLFYISSPLPAQDATNSSKYQFPEIR